MRQGKGKKDRVIPIGDRAIAWIQKYLREARPTLVLEPDDATLFLSADGVPIGRDHLTFMAQLYHPSEDRQCRSLSPVPPHHGHADVENGADIRFIQQMLEHSKLSGHADLHSGVDPHVEARSRSPSSATVAEAGASRKLAKEEAASGLSKEELFATLAVEAEEEKQEQEKDDGIIAPWPNM